MSILKNKYFKFGVAATIYLLWVIWVGNYFLLIGLAVLFDIYVSKKVHWAFWKKKGVAKQTALVEWIDALIFAVVAASLIRLFFIEAFTIPTSSMEKSLLVGDYLFVSKVSYGPKMPNTPLSFPFVHHTLPLSQTKKSYLNWINQPYKRIAGFGKVKRNDVVVFNFPAGDTVLIYNQAPSFSSVVRKTAEKLHYQFGDKDSLHSYLPYYEQAKNIVLQQEEITVRPVDKRENYIKRCVAIAGDEIEIKSGNLYVNGKPQEVVGKKQFMYFVETNGNLAYSDLRNLDISVEDIANSQTGESNKFLLPLNDENYSALKNNPAIKSIEKYEAEKAKWSIDIFPHHPNFAWNEDNFGPLWIPKKGETVKLTIENLPLYHRVIDLYEENELVVKGDKIIINGKEVTEYTFKMDYFFMMGDNRHNSADSRFWGFVPEDHVVGKAVFIWLSTDKDEKFLNKIRWSRLFRVIK